MDQSDDQVKQESTQHIQELQKRRILEQRRADYYTKRQQELEQAQEDQAKETENKTEAREKLQQQILLAQKMKERAA